MSGYNNVIFLSSVSGSIESAFTSAENYWNRAITSAPVDPVSFPSAFSVANLCGVDFTYPAGSSIQGLDIFASVVGIDGTGGILGQAGPCGVVGNFPRLGIMQFDSADANTLVSQGSFPAVIKHEMAHVIGIGTSWSGFGIISGAGGSNPFYTGSNGNAGFAQLGGSGNIPIENTGGAGTRDGHWRESVFQNELMTGFLNSGNNPNSIMTIRSLADLGYSVNTAAAESYSIPKEGTKTDGVVLDLNGDFLDFGYQDLELAITENEANVRANQELFNNIGLGVAAFLIATALVVIIIVVAKRSKKTVERQMVEEQV